MDSTNPILFMFDGMSGSNSGNTHTMIQKKMHGCATHTTSAKMMVKSTFLSLVHYCSGSTVCEEIL